MSWWNTQGFCCCRKKQRRSFSCIACEHFAFFADILFFLSPPPQIITFSKFWHHLNYLFYFYNQNYEISLSLSCMHTYTNARAHAHTHTQINGITFSWHLKAISVGASYVSSKEVLQMRCHYREGSISKCHLLDFRK